MPGRSVRASLPGKVQRNRIFAIPQVDGCPDECWNRPGPCGKHLAWPELGPRRYLCLRWPMQTLSLHPESGVALPRPADSPWRTLFVALRSHRYGHLSRSKRRVPTRHRIHRPYLQASLPYRAAPASCDCTTSPLRLSPHPSGRDAAPD